MKLLGCLLGQESEDLPLFHSHESETFKLSTDFQVCQRGCELHVVAPHGDSCSEGIPMPSLVKAVARAHDWYLRILAGEFRTIDQLAQKSGLTQRYVRRILQCATLSPRITEAVLAGKHRPDLTLKEILHGISINWRAQEKQVLQLI